MSSAGFECGEVGSQGAVELSGDEALEAADGFFFGLALGDAAGTVARVARQLGYGEESLRRWVAQAEIDAGARAGVSTAESVELRRLRQENRELRRADEIGQRAAVFFG